MGAGKCWRRLPGLPYVGRVPAGLEALVWLSGAAIWFVAKAGREGSAVPTRRDRGQACAAAVGVALGSTVAWLAGRLAS